MQIAFMSAIWYNFIGSLHQVIEKQKTENARKKPFPGRINKKIRRVHYSTKKHRQTLKIQHYLTVLTIYLTANKLESRCIFSFFKSMDG